MTRRMGFGPMMVLLAEDTMYAMISRRSLRKLILCAFSCFPMTKVVGFKAPKVPWNHHWTQPQPTSSLFSAPSDVFVVSWDGCIADTVEWRTEVGLETALNVWSELGDSVDGTDTAWLYNKIRALSHVLHQVDDTFSATCDYAMMARLLVEEQELDGGRSNNKSGKYASKYHPKGAESTATGAQQGSRPLTVGEIAVNWNEGGMIRDTLQIKYHANYKDPMPLLQTQVERIQSERSSATLPIPKSSCFKALSEFTENQVILTIRHISDMQTAENCLTDAHVDYQVVDNVDEALSASCKIALVLKTRDTVDTIIKSSPADTTIYVIDSSWYALQKEIPLFGYNIPRVAGVGKTEVPDRRLSLCLAKWAPGSHPTHESAATMNPWTNLIDLNEFSALLSSRFTRR